jgi:hypothetical protein
MNRSVLLILTHNNYFTILALAFLFISKATRHYKINNMKFMNLNMLSNFMKVLNISRKHSTKNECFPKHILFTKIYLLHK